MKNCVKIAIFVVYCVHPPLQSFQLFLGNIFLIDFYNLSQNMAMSDEKGVFKNFKSQAYNFIKKDTLAQVFPVNFAKFLKVH